MAVQTILLLEDDEILRLSLVDLLEDEGYAVLQASESAQAISWARRSEKIDLVVTDVRMAGPDGIDTLALLRDLQADLKSIVITGFASQSAPARAIQNEASDYLYKPFSLEEFVRVVRRVLESGEENRGYQALLGKVMSGVKSLREMASSTVLAAQLAVVEKSRSRAFQGFYVSMRSRRLTQGESMEIWEQMGVLEDMRQDLAGRGSLQLEVMQRLAEGYKVVSDLLGSLDRAPQAMVLQSHSTPEQRTRFGALYKRVMDGVISPEQLKVASSLKGLASEALRGSVELNQLYRFIWAET